MKKYFALALLVIPALFAFTVIDHDSETEKRAPAGCWVRSSVASNTVNSNESKLEINFMTDFGVAVSDSIRMGYNGALAVLHPDGAGQATITIPSGITRFQFYYNSDFYEVYSDTIHLKGGHIVELGVTFGSADREIMADKPVIYVYPDVTQSVNIQLGVHGTFVFTYPGYNIPNNNDSATNGWTFIADPDGTLHMNGKQYDYLFWDGKIEVTNTFNLKPTGFIVQRDSLTRFFEQKLTAMNLSAREQEDFITYWVPRMQKNEVSYVRFVFNEAYDQFASIKVFPQPKNIFRVMMVWQDASQMETIEIIPQTIPAAKRDGFTVIEWGGMEASTTQPQTTIPPSQNRMFPD